MFMRFRHVREPPFDRTCYLLAVASCVLAEPLELDERVDDLAVGFD
jgi:hypothetical protein